MFDDEFENRNNWEIMDEDIKMENGKFEGVRIRVRTTKGLDIERDNGPHYFAATFRPKEEGSDTLYLDAYSEKGSVFTEESMVAVMTAAKYIENMDGLLSDYDCVVIDNERAADHLLGDSGEMVEA